MRTIVFAFTTGVALGVAGASIFDEPVKTVALIFAICLAHQFTMERS